MIDHKSQKKSRYEILVVDDTPANLQLLTGILAEQGYAVRSASNGPLALRSVAAKAPNLILLDVKMPELDGFEVCRRLKAEEQSRKIPVIFISALDEVIDKVKGFDAGGVDYISKPFQPEEVLARIGVQLRIRQLSDKLREANETLESQVEERTEELATTNAELVAEIAGRVKIQESLRESEERFRSIFSATTTPMAILSPTGDFQQVNPAACRFLGYPEEAFIRLNVREVTHPDDRPTTSTLYEETLVGQRAEAVYEKRYLCKDGTSRWGHTSMAPVTDEQGQVKYFVALTQDITERKEAEAAVRESERRLATLMSNLPGMVYRCRNDRDRSMDFVSEGAQVLTGYAPEELLGNGERTYNDLIHPDDRDWLWQYVQSSVSEGQPFELEYRIRTAGEEERWVWERGRGVFGASGELMALEGFITDITERKLAKEALQKSEERLSLALQVSNEGVWDWNLITDEVFFSPRYFTMLGYEPDEFPKSVDTWKMLMHPDDREEAIVKAKEYLEEKRGKGYQIEFRMCTKDGNAVDILARGEVVEADAAGRPTRMVGTHMDITDRKRAERVLAFREAFERLIAGVSSRFVTLPAAETDSGIDAALRDLGEFAGVDRSYVFSFAADLSEMNNSHEWCASGIEPQIERLQGLPVGEIPWFFERISRQEVVYVPRVKDLPAEAAAEKVHWEEQDIQSMVAVPIIAAGKLTGLLGFDAVNNEKVWTEQELTLLRTVGEIVGSALVRQRAEEEREQLLHDMGERIKELRCLYGMSQLLRQNGSLEKIFRNAVTLIPPGWHYPEITRARLRFDDREYVSAPFEETSWKQAADIVVAGQCRGALEICYLEPRPTLDEGPFLMEERQLLDNLAQNLGETIERKHTEEALQSAHRRLEDIIEFLPDATIVIDKDKKVVAWNRAMEKMTGVGKEEVLEQGDYAYALPFYGTRRPILIDLVGNQDPELETKYDFVKRKGDTLIAETGLPSLNEGRGGYLWGIAAPLLDPQGQIVGAIESIRDITDRKQAEESARAALAEAEEAREKIDAILKSVADGLVVTDLSGRVALMNRAAEQLLDVTLGEAFSRPVGSLPPGKRLEDQVAEVLSGKGQNRSFEWQLNDGTVRPRIIQALTSPVRNSKGRETGTITLLRDLTRERELDRMKNEFISTAAHELRTPLTSVMGFAEVLLKQEEFGVTDPAIQRELLVSIHQKAERLEGIISDLLDLSRIQSGQAIPLKKGPCNISELIKEVASQYQQRADVYSFEVCLPQEPIELCADRDKLEQVLENLISNAIKFSPQGGQVRISGHSEANKIKLIIEDEGIGMSPKQMEKVFDRFYRVDASSTAAEGLGLGMSIAKAIVESHGGEIQVDSEPGKGTRVSVILPFQAPPA